MAIYEVMEYTLLDMLLYRRREAFCAQCVMRGEHRMCEV